MKDVSGKVENRHAPVPPGLARFAAGHSLRHFGDRRNRPRAARRPFSSSPFLAHPVRCWRCVAAKPPRRSVAGCGPQPAPRKTPSEIFDF